MPLPGVTITDYEQKRDSRLEMNLRKIDELTRRRRDDFESKKIDYLPFDVVTFFPLFHECRHLDSIGFSISAIFFSGCSDDARSAITFLQNLNTCR